MDALLRMQGRIPATMWTSVLIAAGFAAAQGPPIVMTLALVLIATGAAMIGGPEATAPTVFVALPFWMFEIPIRSSIFSPLELALLLTGLAAASWLAIEFLRTRSRTVIRQWLPDWGLIALAASLALIACLSLLWVADPDLRPDSVRALRRVILEPMLIIPALVWIVRSGRIRQSLTWLAVPAIGVSNLALIQVVLDRSTVEIGGIGRPIGTFTHPNNLAFYLERVIWFVPVALLPLTGRRSRVVWALAAVVLLACLATLSRGAAIGLAAGACVYFADELRRNWRRIATVAVPLAAVAFLARYLASSSSSVDSRETIWRGSIDMLRDHPWTGVGLDQFLGQYGRRYVRIEGWPERYTSHPHNVVLDFWLSLGVAGLIWLWFLLEQIGRRFRALAGTQRDTIRRAAVAMLVTGLVHGLLDNSFFLADLATWTWIGLVLATPELREHMDD
jgi:O-antigen ligase